MPSVQTIISVDTTTERLRVVRRIDPHGWTDVDYEKPVDAVLPLPSPGVTPTHAETFAR